MKITYVCNLLLLSLLSDKDIYFYFICFNFNLINLMFCYVSRNIETSNFHIYFFLDVL